MCDYLYIRIYTSIHYICRFFFFLIQKSTMCIAKLSSQFTLADYIGFCCNVIPFGAVKPPSSWSSSLMSSSPSMSLRAYGFVIWTFFYMLLYVFVSISRELHMFLLLPCHCLTLFIPSKPTLYASLLSFVLLLLLLLRLLDCLFVFVCAFVVYIVMLCTFFILHIFQFNI